MRSIDKDNNSTRAAAILLDLGAVIFSRRLPFRFSSGILSPVYVDNRLLISHPRERKIIKSLLIQRIKQFGVPDVIAGVATAGIPHAAWLAHDLKLPMVFVRSKPKEHGTGNQIEGLVKRGQKVLVVEDLVSTGASSVGAIKALRKKGAVVKDVIAIYSHGMDAAEKNFKQAGVKFHYLTDTEQVTKIAQKKNLFSGQIETVMEWVKNPKNWSKKANSGFYRQKRL